MALVALTKSFMIARTDQVCLLWQRGSKYRFWRFWLFIDIFQDFRFLQIYNLERCYLNEKLDQMYIVIRVSKS